jgi:hypothetical protein
MSNADHKGDFPMSTAVSTAASFVPSNSVKSSALDANGYPLVFAPPLVAGFRGAPLALSAGNRPSMRKQLTRRNWAKRRAYAA